MFTLEFGPFGGVTGITISGMQMWINIILIALAGWSYQLIKGRSGSVVSYMWGWAIWLSVLVGWMLILVPTIRIGC